MLLALIDLATQPLLPAANDEVAQTKVTAEKKEAKKPNNTGETIIVSSKKISRPFANISFKKLDIYTNPASKADALLAVADLQYSTNNANSAEIILRGGSPRLSRTYFNDVPLYEIVRGSSLLQTTKGFSVFNTTTIKEVETYSTSPPSYFANTAGGAIRIMPDDSGYESASFGMNLVKTDISFTRPIGESKKGFIQIYAEHTNLAPLLSVNPKLENLVKSSKGLSGGISLMLKPDQDSELRLVTIADADDGIYPYNQFDNSEVSIKKNRNYNILSYEKAFGKMRLKIDGAKSLVNETTYLRNDIYDNENEYRYFDANIGGRIGKNPLSYRLGVSSESFDLKSRAQVYRPQFGFHGDFNETVKENYSAAYGFMNYQFSKQLSFAIGMREIFDDRLDLDPVCHFSVSWNSKDKRHNLIGAIGEYSAIVLPYRSAFEGISKAKSKQASIDYKYNNQDTKFAIGIYKKTDELLGEEIDIKGFDASFNVLLNDKYEFSGVFARSLPYSWVGNTKQRGQLHLDYLAKLKLRIPLNNADSINFIATSMSGQVYSKPIGAGTDRFGETIPVYAIKNTEQMGNYNSLDFNYIRQLKIKGSNAMPVVYLNINNLLDTKNQSSIEYNSDFTQSKFRNYMSRTIVFGFLIQY